MKYLLFLYCSLYVHFCVFIYTRALLDDEHGTVLLTLRIQCLYELQQKPRQDFRSAKYMQVNRHLLLLSATLTFPTYTVSTPNS